MGEHDHIVSAFGDELSTLDAMIAEMGGLTERQLADGFNALIKRDDALGTAVIDNDKQIDALERLLEERAISMIARRQPMAFDLRHIMAANRIASDLERIGDLGKNVAKRARAISGESHPKPIMGGLRNMADLALGQLKDVLDAYATRDASKAYEVWTRDENIDSMYNSLFRELLTYMMEDPRNISLCTHFLFIAKNVERAGDHTTNIAENVHYLVHGETISDERPKGDTTPMTLHSTIGSDDGTG